jgi:hypothetical protein
MRGNILLFFYIRYILRFFIYRYILISVIFKDSTDLNALFGSQKNVKGKKLREERLLKVCLVQRMGGKGRNFNKGRGGEYFNSLCVWFKREEEREEILIKYTFGS